MVVTAVVVRPQCWALGVVATLQQLAMTSRCKRLRLLGILYRVLSLPHSSHSLSHLLVEVANARSEAVPQERLQHDLRRPVQDNGVVVHDLVVLFHAGRGVRPRVVE